MTPRIAITLGDPLGIGPEVVVKALSDARVYSDCRPFVVGNAEWIKRSVARFAPSLSVRPIAVPPPAVSIPDTLDVLDMGGPDLSGLEYGTPDPRAAASALAALTQATRMALDGAIDGITTGPIHKGRMRQVGFAFPGHTEFFADAAGAKSFGMMMVGGGLKITLATIHVALRDVVHIKKQTVLDAICLTHRAMRQDFGVPDPKIAVAALNPHGGEGGLFGDEEGREVAPAVSAAKNLGIHATGPHPADTLFYHLKAGRFDAAVALYHDQALIPIKLLAFGDAVNVTLGLPFVRTSVDHGTAYDIAGRGAADAGSLKTALALAAQMARHRASGALPVSRKS